MVINLKHYNDTIGVLYGFCSDALGDENNLIEQYGIADYDCNLREFAEIKSDDDVGTYSLNFGEQYLSLFMNMPLSELGTKRFIWEGCVCSRDCCEACWVQKNMWEAKKMI